MIKDKSLISKMSDLIIYSILALLSILTLYPFIFVMSMSISSPDAVIRQEVWLLPKGFTLESYRLVFQNKQIWQSYANTIWYTVVGTTINVVFTIMGAYALSRKEFFVRSQIMVMVAITMFFSGGLIPTFILINQIGLYNSRWAIVLPSAISAWNLIIARAYFESSIPPSLPESAKIDGCSDLSILAKIVLPLSMPIVAVLTIFCAVGYWNSWFSAVLYLSNQNLHPLQLFLRKVLILNDPSQLMQGIQNSFDRVAYARQLKYATIVVATLPILFIYPFVQKHFVKGVMIGAIKE